MSLVACVQNEKPGHQIDNQKKESLVKPAVVTAIT
jgi:hypothetical protein